MTQEHEHGGDFDWNEMWAHERGDCHEPDRLVLDAVATLPQGGRALDVGCGAGSLLLELARRGWQVTGVDVAANAIAAARKTLGEHAADAELFVGDAAHWTPPSHYELVTNCFALPQRQADQHAAVRMMQRALAPGGTLVLKDFDAGMARVPHFAGFHLPTVEELTALLDELDVVRAGVVETPVHRKADAAQDDEPWSAAFIVARKPGG